MCCTAAQMPPSGQASLRCRLRQGRSTAQPHIGGASSVAVGWTLHKAAAAAGTGWVCRPAAFSLLTSPSLFPMTQRGPLNRGALLTLNAAGNTLPLSAIPVGMAVHNVELRPGAGGQLARSAGASCTLVKKGGPERGGARCCVQQALATDLPPAAVLPHNSTDWYASRN